MSVEKLKIGIVVGSVRKGRNAEAVSNWVYNFATKRNDADYEIVDLINYRLPLLGQEIFQNNRKKQIRLSKAGLRKWLRMMVIFS